MQTEPNEVALDYVEDKIVRQGGAKTGDSMIITSGLPGGNTGSTNAMRIVRIGERRSAQG